MALVLATVRDTVTLVHTSDPDVDLHLAKEGEPQLSGWIPETDAWLVGETATRLQVRPLAGHEMLSCISAGDLGKQALATCTRGLVLIDGVKPTDQTLLGMEWQLLLDLRKRIEELSTAPTKARSTK